MTPLLIAALLAGLQKAPPTPKPVAGLENALDVPYLPGRLTGIEAGDGRLKLNVHWPKEGGPHPCILLVHGGGYGSGDKDTGFHSGALDSAVRSGFVVATMNYLLGRDMFPQVFHDFDAAVRFLRANAETYNIDPERIGAMGFSAGGWLVSSAAYTDAADLLGRGRNAILGSVPADHPDRMKESDRLRREGRLAVPMADLDPPYADRSARLQAVCFDFAHYETAITPEDPATLSWVGEGGKNKLEDPARAAGIDYTSVVIPGDKYRGARAVHVPHLTRTQVPNPAGNGMIKLRERAMIWFRERLVAAPRAVAPEFRPFQRVFDESVEVSVVVPSQSITVRYTTDGTDPTPTSPVLDGTIRIAETTLVKAASFRDGMKPSGVAATLYMKGRVPPAASVEKTILRARVGRPFNEVLGRPVEGAVYRLATHHRPEHHRFKGSFTDFSGIAFDPKTLTLSGTPGKAGVYTLQLRAAWVPGGRATTATAVLAVEE